MEIAGPIVGAVDYNEGSPHSIPGRSGERVHGEAVEREQEEVVEREREEAVEREEAAERLL